MQDEMAEAEPQMGIKRGFRILEHKNDNGVYKAINGQVHVQVQRAFRIICPDIKYTEAMEKLNILSVNNRRQSLVYLLMIKTTKYINI